MDCFDSYKNGFKLVSLCRRKLYLVVFYLNKSSLSKGEIMMSRYILIYKIILVNIFLQKNKNKKIIKKQQKKNIREGNSYFPGTILKQVGHYFIKFRCIQFECPYQRFV